MIIAPPHHQITSIFKDGKDIQTIYHNNRIVFQKNKFQTFYITGTEENQFGELKLPRGTYIVAMCGGGSSVGAWSRVSSNEWHVKSGASAASLYGILHIHKTTTISYQVGTCDNASVFYDYTTNGGNTIHGGGYIQDTTKSKPYATWDEISFSAIEGIDGIFGAGYCGNNQGAHPHVIRSGASCTMLECISVAADVFRNTYGFELPNIISTEMSTFNFGRGGDTICMLGRTPGGGINSCPIPCVNAKPGYLKIEKIKI